MIKNIFVYVVAVCLFVIPTVTFATTNNTVTSYSNGNYSEDELVVLIAKLQKQLDDVRKNKVPCVLADIDLSMGDGEGDGLRDHVKNLQAFLKEKGYLGVDPTGYFGKLTRAALLGYQRNAGIRQTGELNTDVRNNIKNLKCRIGYILKKVEKQQENKEASNAPSTVTAINIQGSGTSVSWTTTGYSKNGFKVVYSKNQGPTYPTRDGDKYIYLSEPNASSTSLDAFSGSGTYYVRACEYLGGACGIYSNQITISL